jgi:hypothetical protein
MNIKRRQSGQIVLILILIMTASLGIGLTIVQRSLTNVSTSTKVEESSRAFSAAEAGVERALQNTAVSTNPSTISINQTELDQSGVAQVDITSGLPNPNEALELEPIFREDRAQFWLADYNTTPPTAYYSSTASNFNVYFGDPNQPTDNTQKPAVEVAVVTKVGTAYTISRNYFDSYSARSPANNFALATCGTNPTVNTVFLNAVSGPSTFYCRATVSYTGVPILVRVRVLYSDRKPQKVALEPTGGGSLPRQAKIITSTGSSGDAKRKIRVTTTAKSVPPLMDYVLFSVTDIEKTN